MLEFQYDFSYILDNYDVNKIGFADIKDILQKVSLDMVSGDNTLSKFADNAVTYLYSGNAFEGYSSTVLVNQLEDVRIIDRSEAAYLLQNDDFMKLIQRAFENDIKIRIFLTIC